MAEKHVNDDKFKIATKQGKSNIEPKCILFLPFDRSERLSGSTLILLLCSLSQAAPPGQHLPLPIVLQDLTTKMRNSTIDWQLNNEEKEALYFSWIKKTIKNVDKIEALYFKNNS